jgi:hypothetical protein
MIHVFLARIKYISHFLLIFFTSPKYKSKNNLEMYRMHWRYFTYMIKTKYFKKTKNVLFMFVKNLKMCHM